MDFDTHEFLKALTSPEFLHGAITAIEAAFVAQAGAVVLGFIVALLRRSHLRGVRAAGWTYVWFFRALPTLLVLFMVYFAVPQLIPVLRNYLSSFVAAVVGLAIVEAAYMAEIIRAALLSVDEGQGLAARALGMTPAKVMSKVVLPQAIRVAIPATGNEFIGMIKYTSLASVIALSELLTKAGNQVSVTFRYAEYYSAAAMYYLVIVSVVMFFQSRLERRYRWLSKGIAADPDGARTVGSALAGRVGAGA